jgi:hypothetical protein
VGRGGGRDEGGGMRRGKLKIENGKLKIEKEDFGRVART